MDALRNHWLCRKPETDNLPKLRSVYNWEHILDQTGRERTHEIEFLGGIFRCSVTVVSGLPVRYDFRLAGHRMTSRELITRWSISTSIYHISIAKTGPVLFNEENTFKFFEQWFLPAQWHLPGRWGWLELMLWPYAKKSYASLIRANVSPCFAAPLELLSNANVRSISDVNNDVVRMARDIQSDIRNITVEVAVSLADKIPERRQLHQEYFDAFENYSGSTPSDNESFDWISKLSSPCAHAEIAERDIDVDRVIRTLTDGREGTKIFSRILNSPGVEILSMEPDMSAFAILVSHGDDGAAEIVKTSFKCQVTKSQAETVSFRPWLKKVEKSGACNVLGDLQLPVSTKVLYFHNARGMSINHFGNPTSHTKEKEGLSFRRGAWQYRTFRQTILAWLWLLASLVLSVYMGYLEYAGTVESIIEAGLKVVEVAAALLITVFGFVKLMVHDDAVLFRLMMGWTAITSHTAYAKYMTKLSDREEALAELSRATFDDRVTARSGACYMRATMGDGTLVADPLPGRSLGRAGYIKLGPVAIDILRKKIVLIEGGDGEVAHLLSGTKQMFDLCAINFIKALVIGSHFDAGHIDFVTRDYKAYAGTGTDKHSLKHGDSAVH